MEEEEQYQYIEDKDMIRQINANDGIQRESRLSTMNIYVEPEDVIAESGSIDKATPIDKPDKNGMVSVNDSIRNSGDRSSSVLSDRDKVEEFIEMEENDVYSE